MEDILCAKNALAVNFDNSEDHKLVVTIFVESTQEE